LTKIELLMGKCKNEKVWLRVGPKVWVISMLHRGCTATLRDEGIILVALNAENCGDQKIVLAYPGETIGSNVTELFTVLLCKMAQKPLSIKLIEAIKLFSTLIMNP